MADQQSAGLLGVPIGVWVALVLGVAGVFALTQKPFQDTRPPTVVLPIDHRPLDDGQNVEARLWEDPLSAVALAFKSKHPPPAYQPGDLNRTIQGNIRSDKKTLILSVMLDGGPYTDDIETRRRVRYAVLAALHRSGFVAANTGHIGYIKTNQVTKAAAAQLPQSAVDANEVAAFEWFQRDNALNDEEATPSSPESEKSGSAATRLAADPPSDAVTDSDHVLLLWLNQEGFREAPIRKLSDLLRQIAGESHALVTHAVLGPASSDGLRAMYKEAKGLGEAPTAGTQEIADKERSPPDLLPLYFYSSRATASDASVLDLKEDEASDGKLARALSMPPAKLEFLRTVTDDHDVADAIIRELKDRKIEQREIALVLERDSLYARGMGRYFGGCWNPPTTDPDPWLVDRWIKSDKVRCFSYLRGLDGLTPTTATSDDSTQTHQSQSGKSDNASSANPAPTDASDAAIGASQLDYLRRLAGTIAELRQAQPRIKAIGVISGDVYDKLLVLQALRSALPNVTYFTFDLDARLLEPGNLKWTRQLLVGSSLGLSLRSPLQGDIPPFRDVYETSTFFATLLAVHRFVSSPDANAAQLHQVSVRSGELQFPECPVKDEKPTQPDESPPKKPPPLAQLLFFDANRPLQPGLQWIKHPRIFEIGRSQAFDLIGEPEPERCDLDRCCKYIAAVRQGWWWNRSKWPVNGFALGLIVSTLCLLAGAVAFGTRGLLGKSRTHWIPFRGPRRWDNTLAWSIFVCVVVIGAIGLWWWLADSITHGWTRVPTPPFGGASQWTTVIVDWATILTAIVLVVRGQRKLYDNAECMRREFGFGKSVRELVQWHKDQQMPKRLRQRGLALFWFPIRPLPRQSGMALANGEVSQLEAIIAQYLHRGTPLARFVRVSFVTAISGALIIVAEVIIGITILQFSMTWLSCASLVATQFLTLWVADALFLSRSFLLALWRDRPEWPDAALKKEYDTTLVPKDRSELWLDLRLIARRTRGVANLVWYPSILLAALALISLTNEFRNFQFADNPIALLVGALFVVASAVALRRAAEFWRTQVKHRYEDERLREYTRPEGHSAKQLESLLERVKTLNEGAFAPYSEQPIVRAVLIPAITYGATLGLQHTRLGS